MAPSILLPAEELHLIDAPVAKQLPSSGGVEGGVSLEVNALPIKAGFPTSSASSERIPESECYTAVAYDN